jgi:hypothetical protein
VEVASTADAFDVLADVLDADLSQLVNGLETTLTNDVGGVSTTLNDLFGGGSAIATDLAYLTYLPDIFAAL